MNLHYLWQTQFYESHYKCHSLDCHPTSLLQVALKYQNIGLQHVVAQCENDRSTNTGTGPRLLDGNLALVFEITHVLLQVLSAFQD